MVPIGTRIIPDGPDEEVGRQRLLTEVIRVKGAKNDSELPRG